MVDYRENAKWTVYIHIVPKELSGYEWDKYYVGITQQNVKRRWGNNGCGYKNIHFSNAIKKYGFDNMLHEIIANNLTHDEANKFEKILIQKLHSNESKFGYNISSGGDGGNKKDLKAVKQYDKKGNFIGVYQSAAEASRNIGCDRTNITHACKNHKLACGYMWCYDDEEIIFPYQRKGQKYVVQKDLSKNVLFIYNSIVEASKETGISRDNIHKCIKGKNSRAGNFIWQYYEDYLKENNLTDEEARKRLFFIT